MKWNRELYLNRLIRIRHRTHRQLQFLDAWSWHVHRFRCICAVVRYSRRMLFMSACVLHQSFTARNWSRRLEFLNYHPSGSLGSLYVRGWLKRCESGLPSLREPTVPSDREVQAESSIRMRQYLVIYCKLYLIFILIPLRHLNKKGNKCCLRLLEFECGLNPACPFGGIKCFTRSNKALKYCLGALAQQWNYARAWRSTCRDI